MEITIIGIRNSVTLEQISLQSWDTKMGFLFIMIKLSTMTCSQIGIHDNTWIVTPRHIIKSVGKNNGVKD